MEEVVGSIPTRSTKFSRLYACRLHPSKRTQQKVLHRLRRSARSSSEGSQPRTDDFHPRTRSMDVGLPTALRNIDRGTITRAAAQELEVASFDSRVDRRVGSAQLRAPRQRRGGRRFDPDQVHQILPPLCLPSTSFKANASQNQICPGSSGSGSRIGTSGFSGGFGSLIGGGAGSEGMRKLYGKEVVRSGFIPIR